MITRKITPALLCGCSVILKPSEFTPFTALYLIKLLEEAGLPGGVLNLITGDAELIGREICNDFRIRKISFTGSTRVGKILYQNSANSLKRLSLELGGNAPFIVFADSDLEKAASDLVISKTRGNGQSCTSANRIFIEESIYSKFTEVLAQKFSSIVIGDCLDASSELGPLINKAGVEKVNKLIDDAKAKHAKVLCGGNTKGNLFMPTVLADCSDEMEIFRAEIFGPVAACYKFSNIEEIVKRANDTEYGLHAYVYSRDLTKAQNVASQLDFGMVAINNSLSANPKAAFSGRKASGFGVEGSFAGLFEYLNTKYINVPIGV
jgi:succinate-semialdehyde dehydrogenase/glutarate-semialdehyde dehydrogenase